MKDIELKINDLGQDGTFAISLVEFPAIEEGFIALSSEDVEFKVIDEERRVVVGLALIPEKRIPRRSDNGEIYNVFFTEETVSLTAEMYMKNLYNNNVTADHKRPVKGATVIESWIVEDTKNDKSNLYNLNAVKGSWVVMMKIYNDDEWSKIKKGEFKGFSIEGKYGSEEKLSKENLIETIKQIIKDGL